MLLQDIGIYPVPFTQATHLARSVVGSCEIYVPCVGREEAERIKQRIEEHFDQND